MDQKEWEGVGEGSVALTHGDLFAGIGGFALAARWCGIKTIWAVEIDPYCQAVYRKHFPDVEIYGDVKEIVADAPDIGCEYEAGARNKISQAPARKRAVGKRSSRVNTSRPLPPVDLLTGGFPCQPFSVAGKRRGTADDRYLWPEMLRIIRAVHPRWVIAENVPGIDDATHLVLDTVTSDLEGIGYAAIPIEIPACAVGAPHRRQRVWVVAYARHCISSSSQDGKDEWWAETPSAGGECRISAAQERGDVADAEGAGQQACSMGQGQIQSRGGSSTDSWWTTEPDVGVLADGLSLGLDMADLEDIPFRVAKGVPERVNQLRALGNAIVPQVAERIMRAIVEVDSP